MFAEKQADGGRLEAMKAAKHSCKDKREGGKEDRLADAWLPLMGTVQKVRPGSLTRGRSPLNTLNVGVLGTII